MIRDYVANQSKDNNQKELSQRIAPLLNDIIIRELFTLTALSRL